MGLCDCNSLRKFPIQLEPKHEDFLHLSFAAWEKLSKSRMLRIGEFLLVFGRLITVIGPLLGRFFGRYVLTQAYLGEFHIIFHRKKHLNIAPFLKHSFPKHQPPFFQSISWGNFPPASTTGFFCCLPQKKITISNLLTVFDLTWRFFWGVPKNHLFKSLIFNMFRPKNLGRQEAQVPHRHEPLDWPQKGRGEGRAPDPVGEQNPVMGGLGEINGVK